jgi:hypothetical protein
LAEPSRRALRGDDRALVEQLLDGDEAAFADLEDIGVPDV